MLGLTAIGARTDGAIRRGHARLGSTATARTTATATGPTLAATATDATAAAVLLGQRMIRGAAMVGAGGNGSGTIATAETVANAATTTATAAGTTLTLTPSLHRGRGKSLAARSVMGALEHALRPGTESASPTRSQTRRLTGRGGTNSLLVF